MPDINIDFVAILDQARQVLEIAALCFGAFIAAFSISLVVWTFRDIRARTHDVFFQLLSVLLVMVFNILGLFLYLILRPKETLAERHEQALAEEALLQELEQRLACPSCGVRVEPDYLLCPVCHTQLKQQCETCGRLNELTWNICPYCGQARTPAMVEPATTDASTPEETQRLFGRPTPRTQSGETPEAGILT